MTTESNYIPGMCNINTKEVASRKKAMWFGVGLSAIVLIILLAVSATWWLSSLALFIPVYIAAIGYLQVRNRFCVSYGAAGLQNATEDSDEARTVADAESIRADRSKTRRMNLQALAITLITIAVTAAVIQVV